ncbi:MAG TPA: DUF169 domain-containing protein [Methanobacteriales archaeon]|nr:MAG: Uncharacterized protein XD44_0239 [Methanobacteriaceae archaeon 41_258]HIH61197.1 DUF169 domain-containing protein [Methanobacteriales archaeon]
MKTEYKNISKKMKDKLGLERSPVAVKLVLHEEDMPGDVERISEPARHCEMVMRASEGEMFYALAEDQECKGGAGAIGAAETPETVKTGEFYYGLGRFSSLPAAKRTLDQIPKINLKFYAVVYAPLEKVEFDPNVILVVCNPAQALKIIQALVYTKGGRVKGDFAGIQSICADAVAGPYTRGEANITLACSGSRQYSNIRDDELVIGLTAENIDCTVEALEEMA